MPVVTLPVAVSCAQLRNHYCAAPCSIPLSTKLNYTLLCLAINYVLPQPSVLLLSSVSLSLSLSLYLYLCIYARNQASVLALPVWTAAVNVLAGVPPSHQTDLKIARASAGARRWWIAVERA
jgi:hypothetical protein